MFCMCFGEVFSVCFCIRKMRFRARHRKNVNNCYSMDSFACGCETRSRAEGKASKTVHVCYSMGLSACGCETRAAPSNSLATTALFTSWNNANALNVFSALSSTLNEITQSFPMFCLCLARCCVFLTQNNFKTPVFLCVKKCTLDPVTITTAKAISIFCCLNHNNNLK